MNALDIISIALSILAMVVSIVSDRKSYRLSVSSSELDKRSAANDVFQQFYDMWIMMDSEFIEHPELHQYFYANELEENGGKALDCKELEKSNPEVFHRAICIAEKFRDVFQYSEKLALSIVNDYDADVRSYYKYMQRITSTPIYRRMEELSPISINETVDTRVGDKIADKLGEERLSCYKTK